MPGVPTVYISAGTRICNLQVSRRGNKELQDGQYSATCIAYEHHTRNEVGCNWRKKSAEQLFERRKTSLMRIASLHVIPSCP